MKLSKWTPYFVIMLMILHGSVGSNGKAGGTTEVISISPDQSYDAILPLVEESSVVFDGQIGNEEYGGNFVDPDTGIEVYWEHDLTNLSIGLIGPSTGWVAIVIGDGMSGGDIIIGGVFDNASVFAHDTYGVGKGGPPRNDTTDGGTYDILEYSLSEDTSTTFEFRIPLNSGDSHDEFTEPGQEKSFYLVYAPSGDDYTVQHTPEDHSDELIVLVEGLVKEYPHFDTSIPLVTSSNVTIDGLVSENEYAESFRDPVSRVQVYWEHDNTNYNMALVSHGTGWLAIGFGFFMSGSPMILGGVADGQTYCYDMVGLATYSVALDTDQGGTDDILACQATESEEQTILEFTFPMNSDDSLDPSTEQDEVYDLMLGYHISSDSIETIHTAKSQFTALVRPETALVRMNMDLVAPSKVQYNDSFTYEVHLYDENMNNFSNSEIIFFIETALGDLKIGTARTNENGLANFTYRDEHLKYTQSFGAKFSDTVGIPEGGGDVSLFQGVKVTAEIDFLEAPKEDKPFLQQYSREGLILLFWITGLIIWGSFSVSLYGVIVIFGDREKGEKKKETNMEGKKEELNTNE